MPKSSIDERTPSARSRRSVAAPGRPRMSDDSVISRQSRAGASPVSERTRCDGVGEVVVAELRDGDVDRHRATGARPAPSRRPGGRPAGSTKRADRGDLAGSSAMGMNSSGGTSAALGMLPAHQRLGPDDVAGRDFDERLVVHEQLVAFERVAQCVLGRQMVRGAGLQLMIEQAPRLTGGLCVAHRTVGFSQQLLGGPRGAVRRCDADRGVDDDV